VLQQTGVSAIECLAIEDSANGLKAALGASIARVITTNTYTLADDFRGASLIVKDLEEPNLATTLIGKFFKEYLS
jgi:beta-phosphoglucomutase-like phosphatase (HAD superfamily)